MESSSIKKITGKDIRDAFRKFFSDLFGNENIKNESIIESRVKKIEGATDERYITNLENSISSGERDKRKDNKVGIKAKKVHTRIPMEPNREGHSNSNEIEERD